MDPSPDLVDAMYRRIMQLYDEGLRREPLSNEDLSEVLNEVMRSQKTLP